MPGHSVIDTWQPRRWRALGAFTGAILLPKLPAVKVSFILAVA
jgi:hypothetical protein